MESLLAPLCVILLVVGTVAWLLFVASLLFSPARQQQHLLKKEARSEYRNARGTLHLKLLGDAKERLDKEASTLDARIARLRRKEADLRADRDAALHAALSRHLIETHLTEVPGIGPSLQERIINEIYRDKLDDLRYAYRVQGVGASRQEAINLWTERYRSQFPTLLQQPFPQRDAILASYDTNLGEIAAELDMLRASKEDIQQKRQLVEQEIERLREVSVEDFVAAMLGPEQDSEKINHYLRGVFAEWEPVPDWFSEVVTPSKR